jgi:hypothetical protein
MALIGLFACFNNIHWCWQVITLRGTSFGTSPRGEEDVGLLMDPQNRPRRASSVGWSTLAVVLAFVDWFHIAFNLMNLNVIRSTKILIHGCTDVLTHPHCDVHTNTYVRTVLPLSSRCRHAVQFDCKACLSHTPVSV